NGSLEPPRILSQLLTLHGCWPSSQTRVACWHPVFGSQVSIVHWSWSLQSSGASCVHLPFWQEATPVVHWFPSPHVNPSGCCAWTQVWPPTQVSDVQPSPSLQLAFALPGGGSPGTCPSPVTARRWWPASV